MSKVVTCVTSAISETIQHYLEAKLTVQAKQLNLRKTRLLYTASFTAASQFRDTQFSKMSLQGTNV